MNDQDKPKPDKPYTRYRSSRLRSKPGKPLRPEGKPGQGKTPGTEARRKPAYTAPVTKPARQRSWWRIAGIALLLLLLVLLVFSGISYWRVDRAVRASNARVPAEAEAVLTKPAAGLMSGPQNILFIGSDQRPGEPARADTLLLMRVDRTNRSISKLSIPRDTLVDIPGYGEGKINSAYAYGGPALQIQTIEQLTGLPVHHYVELDFDGFPEIVDALGGVDINVPEAIDSQYPEGLDWTQVHFDAGPQHMDGATALVFVRVRYSDDDFHRMGRQQQFMDALQKRVASPLNLAKMPSVAPKIVNNMTTDLSTNDLIKLAWIKFRAPAANSRSVTLVGSGQYIGGVSYVVLDEEASNEAINRFLGN